MRSAREGGIARGPLPQPATFPPPILDYPGIVAFIALALIIVSGRIAPRRWAKSFTLAAVALVVAGLILPGIEIEEGHNYLLFAGRGAGTPVGGPSAPCPSIRPGAFSGDLPHNGCHLPRKGRFRLLARLRHVRQTLCILHGRHVAGPVVESHRPGVRLRQCSQAEERILEQPSLELVRVAQPSAIRFGSMRPTSSGSASRRKRPARRYASPGRMR